MRLKNSTWFECKVRYDKMQETGLQKKVTELYVVEALSFTDAEAAIIEEMMPYISGEFEITGIKPATFRQVCFCEDEQAERWYKVKILYITLDEKTMKEKRTPYLFLVQEKSFDDAVRSVTEAMKGTLGDYVKAQVAETKILDVFEHRTVEETPD